MIHSLGIELHPYRASTVQIPRVGIGPSYPAMQAEFLTPLPSSNGHRILLLTRAILTSLSFHRLPRTPDARKLHKV